MNEAYYDINFYYENNKFIFAVEYYIYRRFDNLYYVIIHLLLFLEIDYYCDMYTILLFLIFIYFPHIYIQHN